MHTNRTGTAAVLLAAVIGLATVRLLPGSTRALVLSEERTAAQQAFSVALNDAASEYQRSRGLPALQRRYEDELSAATKQTAALMREKRIVRFRIAVLRRKIAEAKQSTITPPGPSPAVHAQSGSTLLARLIPGRSLAGPPLSVSGLAHTLGRTMLVAFLGKSAQDFFRWQDLREPLLAAIQEAHRSQEIDALQRDLSTFEHQYADLLAQTNEALSTENGATQKLQNTTEQFTRIQQNMLEVHSQVLRLQGELSRIDAEIRDRVEKELMAKGLLTPGTIDHAAVPEKPQFAWPAYGRRSAGFLNPTYQERFGIPHYGLDIAVAQGSPVYSAADGVVFVARDGGATKYSYVLVGHRDGYATLYGHLSKIAVTAGQDLRQGQLVGLSGGAVGAPGSGPTTTGPHLHFEVLERGTNIDPASVLP